MVYIDINADLGEGSGFDAQLMPFISSCSVACGGHAGDEETMHDTVRLAMNFNVKVGAHPSFPDKDNFGRKVLTMTKEQLVESVMKQLRVFYDVCYSENVSVHHIKLHGALYNYAAKDAPTADAVVEAVIASGKRPQLYVPYGSILHRKAENLLPLRFEAFIDRAYRADLSLVPRSEQGAVLHHPEIAWKQLFDLVIKGKVKTITGEEKELVSSTYCIHGDHKNSVAVLKYIHQMMKQHSIALG